MSKPSFATDYEEGAHPAILKRLVETNLEQSVGYGLDPVSESARDRIRTACACPQAAVHFLIGGTQVNATMLDALLASYEGVVAADTAHVALHEAGAIEAGGHKVLTLPGTNGKITSEQVDEFCSIAEADGSRDHMVFPGVVYLSQPTEYGTLYSLDELERMRTVCDRHSLRLYIDGARLAYALASPANDVTIPDLARLCDAFYIGGTKCGALLGEALHLLVLKHDECLVGRGVKGELEADLLEQRAQGVGRLERGLADAQVEIVAEELVELDAQQAALGEQRPVLLDDCEEVGDEIGVGHHYGLAKQRPALGAADVEGVGKACQVGEGHIVSQC